MLRLLQRHYRPMGSKLEPVKNPHGFADVIKRYFAGDLSALDTLPVEPPALRFNVRSGARSGRFLVELRSATQSWPNRSAGLSRASRRTCQWFKPHRGHCSLPSGDRRERLSDGYGGGLEGNDGCCSTSPTVCFRKEETKITG